MVTQPHSPLGFFGIIRESFKTTSRNLDQLLYPMILLTFLSLSQFDFAQVYMFAPVAKAIKLQLERPNMFHILITNYNYINETTDVRDFLLYPFLILVISSIVTLFVLIATVSSSSEAYTAKPFGIKDMLLKLIQSWKRSLLTSFYMFLFTLGILFLYLISIVITSIFTVNCSMGILVFRDISITVWIPVCYCYVAATWIVSMVVSVLEEDCGGFKAIGRAGELMKGRRSLHASLMMLLFVVAYTVVHVMANCLESYLNLSTGITSPFRNVLLCWLKLFMFVVYTVFYHEWKTISYEEKEGKGDYLPIAAGGSA